MKLSRAEMSKLIKPGGFISRLFGALLKTCLTFMKNVLQRLAKSILIPLTLTIAVSATNSAIQNKINVSWATILKDRIKKWKMPRR